MLLIFKFVGLKILISRIFNDWKDVLRYEIEMVGHEFAIIIRSYVSGFIVSSKELEFFRKSSQKLFNKYKIEALLN